MDLTFPLKNFVMEFDFALASLRKQCNQDVMVVVNGLLLNMLCHVEKAD
jgi:hypothetical protein